MIELRDVSKGFPAGGGRHLLFDRVSIAFPSGARVAVLGPNGAGKSTFLGLIGGTVAPDRGTIRRHGTVSWPMGFSGGFAPDLTGRQNVRFVSRIYGAATGPVEESVQSFAGLGSFFDMPLRTYSAGMRARLAFGLSIAIRFDWYLVDEIAAVGDADFRRQSAAAFHDRLCGAGLLMVSHAPALLREFCTSAVVIDRGGLRAFECLEAAIAYREEGAGA